ESGEFRPLPIAATYSLDDAATAYQAVADHIAGRVVIRPSPREAKTMSSNLTEQTLTAAVQQTFDNSSDERFRQVFTCLVQHLHDFAREVRLTGDEWFTAMDFLERVGKISTPTRQEFVMLSDILGLSMLLDKINQHTESSTTDSALLG